MYVLRPPAESLRPYIEHYWFVSQSERTSSAFRRGYAVET
jgi:hypothetical protein